MKIFHFLIKIALHNLNTSIVQKQEERQTEVKLLNNINKYKSKKKKGSL